MSENQFRPVAIERTLPWGQIVRGMRWGEGADRVVLLHEPGADVDAWGPLPAYLASRLPIRVEAFDLPGHGLSDDPWQPEQFLELLREILEKSSGRRFVVGAGASGGTALTHAAELAVAGIVGFSADATVNDVLPRSPRVPKLLFAGSLAGDDLHAARRLAAVIGGWSVVTGVPVDSRGTALLASSWQTQLCEQTAAFIRDCLHRPSIHRS